MVDSMEINNRACCYCGTCVNVCPQGAIELVDSGIAVLDESKCVQSPCKRWVCGYCVDICPLNAVEV